MTLAKRMTTSILGLSICSLSWFTLSITSTLAQSTSLGDRTIQYIPPSLGDRGRPDGRQGGAASRSSCFLADEGEPNLTALVPAIWVASNDIQESTDIVSDTFDLSGFEAVFSLTTATHPSFWFYVPDVPNEDLILEFILQNEQGRTLYQSELTGSDHTGGIIEVSLPETLPELTVDESYQWYLIAQCNNVETANSFSYTKGWITRTELESTVHTQLANATGVEQASIYAANSIWHETLGILSELLQQEPENVAASDAWLSLLKSVGLESVSDKSMIDCCTPIN